MGRRRHGRDVHGIVLLDKPAAISSNRALQKVRYFFEARKAGHTGSLDPFATGLLPICLGEASKTAAFMLDADKSYRATARLGTKTATGDTEGEVIAEAPPRALQSEEIATALAGFTGETEQVPPMYSALKHKGEPLYKLAREGKRVERKPRRIRIERLELVGWQSPDLEFEVVCSKGTYIRTLAEDIARSLGSCAHLIALRRLWVEPFEAAQMVTLDALEAAREDGTLDDHLLPVDAGLIRWPVLELDPQDARRFRHGNFVAAPEGLAGRVRVYREGGGIIGFGTVGDDGVLRPRRVFNMGAEGSVRDTGTGRANRPEAPEK